MVAVPWRLSMISSSIAVIALRSDPWTIAALPGSGTALKSAIVVCCFVTVPVTIQSNSPRASHWPARCAGERMLPTHTP